MTAIPIKLIRMNTFEGQLLANRYLIKKELGRGGMAIIYTGTDTILKREIAVKILYPQFISDSSLLQRFVNEARIIAELNYKNIVSLYDISEHEGVPFLILEYVHGEDLRRLYDRLYDKVKKPSLEIALIIAYIVCDAVAHAHAHGIVHRDIKPENVLISGHGDMKITDFGLAHILTDTRITITGAAIGSPEFMSPEHINSSNINAASDVFSLGSLLYWLITGASPFYADNTMSILNNISRNNYKPISTGTGIDDWIAGIIHTCLQPKPEDRYEDASRLSAVLNDALHGFTSDPYGAFHAYIHEPDKTALELLRKHNSMRYNNAVSYIKSNRFEKALSTIGIMLETNSGQDAQPTKGDGNSDAVKLLKALKYSRYKRWAYSAVEVIFVILAVMLMAREEYIEAPARLRVLQPGHVNITRNQATHQLSKNVITGNEIPPLSTRGTESQSNPEADSRKSPRSLAIHDDKKNVLQNLPLTNPMPKPVPIPLPKPLPKIVQQQAKTDTGNLELITYPWAMVFIDGKYAGETPRLKTLSLSTGKHELYIMNPYLKPFSETITIHADQTFTKRINLNE